MAQETENENQEVANEEAPPEKDKRKTMTPEELKEETIFIGMSYDRLSPVYKKSLLQKGVTKDEYIDLILRGDPVPVGRAAPSDGYKPQTQSGRNALEARKATPNLRKIHRYQAEQLKENQKKQVDRVRNGEPLEKVLGKDWQKILDRIEAAEKAAETAETDSE